MFGGTAIAEAIYGKYNPSVKRPMSIPGSTGQVNVWYNHYPGLYFKDFVFGKMGPLYEFGFGLSYTTFSYANLSFDKQVPINTSLKVKVTVNNTGGMDGDEIVLCFINDKISSVATPVKKLVEFKRISLNANESENVKFEITPDDMSFWNSDMEKVVEKGEFELMIGTLKDTFEVI